MRMVCTYVITTVRNKYRPIGDVSLAVGCRIMLNLYYNVAYFFMTMGHVWAKLSIKDSKLSTICASLKAF